MKHNSRNRQLSKEDCQNIPFEIVPGSYASIEVRDTGSGISTDLQQKIFEPFFTTKEIGKGTGMGLSAVYGTIKEHHGAIRLESREGSGSTFTILLPTTDKPFEAPAADEGSPTLKTVKGCILLIDDEEVIRTIIPELLGSIGYTTLTAYDGLDGLQTYRENQNQIDLVILDMITPRMDGAVCFAGLKEINPDVKVIISSGYTQNASTSALKQEGVLAFIKKPFQLQTLSDIIADILQPE